jgi:glycosyltransferase involved in cell wall biosynthesis
MHYKDVLLVIAGPDDGYLKEAKSLTRALGVKNRVIFTGLLPEMDKIAAYVDSSLLAYLGPFEPYGLVPLEGAACEIPVVVAQGTPMSEIVNEGKFGFSVNYGNIEELAKVMHTVLCNECLQRDMGRSGRIFVLENFTWVNIVEKLEKIYDEAIRWK